MIAYSYALMNLSSFAPVLALVLAAVGGGRVAIAGPGPADPNPGISGTGASQPGALGVAARSPSGSAEDPTELSRKGIEAVNRLDFEAACKLFRRSLELRPSVKVLLNLAVAELNAGHPLDAAEHFRAYVLAPDAAPDRAHTVREDFLPKAYGEVGRLMFDVPDGTPIRLNGKAIVVHPGDDNAVLIPPGPVRLELSDGRMVRVTVDKGQVAHIVFPSQPATAVVSPFVPPSKIDGAQTPPPGGAGSAGGEGGGTAGNGSGDEGADHGRGGTGGAGPSTRTWVLIGGGLLTVTSVATGVYFTVASNSAGTEAARLKAALPSGGCVNPTLWKQTCLDLQDAVTRGPRDQNIAAGAWITAGVFGAATAITWFAWPTTREQRVTVLPAAWRGGWGAVASATF